MQQNKTAKYFKYAIGEIVLVVIGILIALQINNYNQNNINKQYEATMLAEIENALQKDIGYMQNKLAVLDDLKNSVRKLAIIKDDPSYPNDSLNFHFTKVRRGGVALGFNYSPYESLKSTGLDKISNAKLRNSITNLYELELKGADFWINDYVRRLLYKRGDLVGTIFQKKVTPDPIDGIKIEYLINYNSIKKNKDFDEFLLLSGGYIPIAIRNIQQAITAMKTVAKEIEVDLKK